MVLTLTLYSQSNDELINKLKLLNEHMDSLNDNSKKLSKSADLAIQIYDIKNQIRLTKIKLNTLSNDLDNPIYVDTNINTDSNLSLLDFRVYETSINSYEVYARIKNKQRKYLEWVKLYYNIYNDGVLINSDFTYIDFESYGYTGISPYKTTFINTFFDKAVFDSISYSFDYDIENGNDDILWDQILQFESNIIENSGSSFHKWYGSVANNTDYSMTFSSIYACVIKNNHMVNFDYTFVDVDNLYFNSLIIQSVTTTPTSSERVTLKNYSDQDIDISGWTIGDLNDPTAYTIPQGTVIYSGLSKTFDHSQLGFQINDTGETIYLKNGYGTTVDTWNESIGEDREYKNYRFKEQSSASFDSYIDLPSDYDEIIYYFNYALYSLDGSGNLPPNKPIFTENSCSGLSREKISFDIFVIDPNGNSSDLLLDYGDGSTMNWEGSFYSGYNADVEHAFSTDGQYIIKAKSKDDGSLETDWSENITVDITESSTPQLAQSVLDSAIYKNYYSEQLSASSGILPYSWHVTNGSLPDGLNLNINSGLVSGQPTQSGNYEFTVTVSDAGTPSLSDESVFNIFVFNHTPAISSDDTVNTFTNTQITYVASATDADGNTISYDFINYPSWLTKTNSTLFGTSPSIAVDTSFYVIATDGELSDTLKVNLIVNEQTSVLSQNTIPQTYSLFPNFPNPFNPQTNVKIALPQKTDIKIYIYDLNGRIISKVFEGQLPPGYHSFVWNAGNQPSGTYYIKVQSTAFSKVTKCLLLK